MRGSQAGLVHCSALPPPHPYPTPPHPTHRHRQEGPLHLPRTSSSRDLMGTAAGSKECSMFHRSRQVSSCCMLQDDLTVFTQQSAPQRCLISLVTSWIADLRACVYVKGPEYPVITRSARKIKPAAADCLSHCPSAGNLGLRHPRRWKHSQLAEPSAEPRCIG